MQININQNILQILTIYLKSILIKLRQTVQKFIINYFNFQMSTKAQHIRQSKSSNQESFQALNDLVDRTSLEQHKSRPSQSSDYEHYEHINQKIISLTQSPAKKEQNQDHFIEEINALQKIIVSSEKSIQEQLEILKNQHKEKQKEIISLRLQNFNLKTKNQQLQENLIKYKEQLDKINKNLKQQQTVSSSLKKQPQQLFSNKQNYQDAEKDFTKKKTSSVSILNPLQQELTEALKQKQVKIQSLSTKIQLFLQQDGRIRAFLNKFLKFNPSFTMQLSTLVQSAVIDLDSNLKELNRQIQNIILECHLGNANKIAAKRQKIQEQRYNHWQTLNSLQAVKSYCEENYKRKL